MSSEAASSPAIVANKELDSAPAARYVPGAPPSTKSAIKKKRGKPLKPKSEKDAEATGDEEAKEGSAIVEPQPAASVAEAEKEKKPPSPIVELINKRTRPLKKKITRFAAYKSKPESELNEDQKTALASLPGLEASLKEAEEIQKAIETLEAELERENAQESKKQAQRHQESLNEAIANAEAKTIPKITFVLSLLSLSSALQTSATILSLDELDRNAVTQASTILLGSDVASKEQIINGLLNDSVVGEVDGVTYHRLRELARNFASPAQPLAQEQIDDIDEAAAAQPSYQSVSEAQPQPPAQAFSFMQESELDPSANAGDLTFGNVGALEASVDSTQDWVNVQKETGEAETGEGSVGSAPEHITAPEVPETVQVTAPAGQSPLPPAPIDWAADDNEGLPSIDTLHAKFGTSGDATPVEGAPASDQATPIAPLDNTAGPGTPPQGDSEWRTPNPSGGGRRARGGYYRGGPPGDRERGGSGFRGRGRGFRGDGEYRGRGRGGYGGEDRHGSAPSTPTGGPPEEDGWRTQGPPRPRGGSGFRPRGGSGFRARGGGQGGGQGGTQSPSNPPPAQ